MLHDNAAGGFIANRWSAQQVVCDQKTVIIMNQPEQTPQSIGRIVDCIVDDPAIARVVRHDAVLGGARDEVIPHDTARCMHRHSGRFMRVAQSDARVAVNDDVSFNDAILRLVPEKNSAARAACSALDADKDIVGYYPILSIHGPISWKKQATAARAAMPPHRKTRDCPVGRAGPCLRLFRV